MAMALCVVGAVGGFGILTRVLIPCAWTMSVTSKMAVQVESLQQGLATAAKATGSSYVFFSSLLLFGPSNMHGVLTLAGLDVDVVVSQLAAARLAEKKLSRELRSAA